MKRQQAYYQTNPHVALLENDDEPDKERRKRPFGSFLFKNRITFGVLCVACILVVAFFQVSSSKQEEVTRMFHGYVPRDYEEVTEYVQTSLPEFDAETFPKTWSWTDVNGKDLTSRQSHNQHQPYKYCGACWIFGSIAVIDDRLAIQNPDRNVMFSGAHQAVVNCGPNFQGGCNGGEPNQLFQWVHEEGLPETSCINYVAENHECSAMGRCQDCLPIYGQPADTCAGKPAGTYTIATIDEWGRMEPPPGSNLRDPSVIQSMVQQMKAEIHHRGPIVCAIICTDPFIKYAPVHPYTEGELPGNKRIITYDEFGNSCGEAEGGSDISKCLDHNVEVLGWGRDDGMEYWLVRNSWGTWWGEDGFFRVETGKNTIGIESVCDWAVPRIIDNYVHLQEFEATKLIRKANAKHRNAVHMMEHLAQH